MNALERAHEWIAADLYAVRSDIARLGIMEAARYNRELVKEAISRGDTRWRGVTVRELAEAMRTIAQEGVAR